MSTPNRSRSATYARRRRRRVASRVNDLTDAQWLALMEAWAGCAYCGAEEPALQRDTMLPISRGGRYSLDNVVPACRSCNASKGNLELTTWMRRKKLDEKVFLVRQYEVLRALAAIERPDGPGPEQP